MKSNPPVREARYKVNRRGGILQGVPPRRFLVFPSQNVIFSERGNPMLVLTRKLNESIIISDNIRVTIVAIDGNKVRLGITAPPDVRVDREEVARRIRDLVELQVIAVESP